MKKLTFAEFCAAFDLGPFVPLRQACKVEGVGMTKLYEKTGPKRQAAHLQKRQAVKPLGAGALRSLCTAPGNSRRLAGRMNGRNGPGRAPRATLALNGFCGPSEQFRGAQRSAQAHLTHFGVQPEVPSRIRAALPGELPRIMRRQVVTCEPQEEAPYDRARPGHRHAFPRGRSPEGDVRTEIRQGDASSPSD